jgi:transposase
VAKDHLRRCNSAGRRPAPPFVNLARRLRRHFDGIVAAVEWGLSNSRLEAIDGKIRLINRRGYGHHPAKALASMIYLCLGGITVTLPTQR